MLKQMGEETGIGDHGQVVHDDDVNVNGEDTAVAPSLPIPSTTPWIPIRARWSRFLERLALAVENPVNKLTGSTQLNPFYHTGTIAVFLMIIVGLSGVYLYLFYKYGFDASYEAVQTRIEGPFIARIVRAMHKYASGALVVTTLLHAYRTLFMERFRGPRWLAWLTGIFMTFLLWLAGVTGYWLVWDVRAQLITDAFVDFLQNATPFASAFMVMLASAEVNGVSWPIFLATFGIHVLLYLIVGIFFWLHIRRLQRPKWLPPAEWVVMMGLLILVISAFFPVGLLPKADFSQVPSQLTFDPLFLFYLPFKGNTLANWLLWGGLAALTLILAALPWVSKDRRLRIAKNGHQLNELQPPAQNVRQRPLPPLVNIIEDRCTGCTKCALDCPYHAITMVERHDHTLHKYIAVADPSLCVSCGICVGSCDDFAVTMGDISPDILWQTVQSRLQTAQLSKNIDQIKVMVTCERHASFGALPYLQSSVPTGEENPLEVIALPCVGTALPNLLTKILDAGVAEVQIVGCPPDDCVNREGNLWTEQRLIRDRVPRLKRAYANAPITAAWLAPDDFAQALKVSPLPLLAQENGAEPHADYLEQRRMFKELTWRNYGPALLLLALVMILQVLLTDLPLRPGGGETAVAQIVIIDIAEQIGRTSYISTTLGPTLHLQVIVNDQLIYEEDHDTTALLAAETTPIYLEQYIKPGQHHLRLILTDDASSTTFVLYEAQNQLIPGQILRILR